MCVGTLIKTSVKGEKEIEGCRKTSLKPLNLVCVCGGGVDVGYVARIHSPQLPADARTCPIFTSDVRTVLAPLRST